MTRRRVFTTRRADDDIDAALEHYIGEGATDAAYGFIDALEHAKGLLGEHPSIGSPRYAIETGIVELRGLALQRFPYVVLDEDGADAVRIYRVLHSSRDIPAEFAGE